MTNYHLLANAVRMLSIDAVEKAKSGHPGAPMGMAEIGAVLWRKFMQHNPLNPQWINRDRFVLSNGHASMLQYSLLHLTGYALTIDDLQNFRKLHSKTPGHPEYRYTPGVETTTGPLGQGIANAVGMALAEKLLAAEFNRDEFSVVDHYTYAFAGDGCLMEGISHEACSLAGTWGLGKLILFYDDNGISIDGEVAPWFNENVKMRFEAYNWQVIGPIDGHNPDQIAEAITLARTNTGQPTIIICKTVIGFGSPNKAGGEDCHGSPLGSDEIKLVRQQLDWPYPPFEVPSAIYQEFDCKAKGEELELAWNALFAEYKAQYPQLASELLRRNTHQLPDDWSTIITNAITLAATQASTVATRKASQLAIEYYAQFLPELLGGSADLTGSNLTNWSKSVAISPENKFIGNYVSYGVREFGMSAIMNGVYLHGGLRPFGGTFLMFSEYARNALRMASLMKIAPIFVYTHDSIGLGEDGPTHQPVEQIATLRLIPNMQVWRPCDPVETMAAWGVALSQTTTPSSLVFCRQNLPFINRTNEQITQIINGAYILHDGGATPDVLIIATGSEVHLALEVTNRLVNDYQQTVRLVSMPSTSVFDQQPEQYKNTILSGAKYSVAIEAGSSGLWYKYLTNKPLVIGIDAFGESAPAADLFDYFGFTVDKIIARFNQHGIIQFN